MGLPLGADLEEAHTAPQHAINGHFHGTSVLLAAANATGPACTDNAGYTGHNTALWTETSIGVNGFLWNKIFYFLFKNYKPVCFACPTFAILCPFCVPSQTVWTAGLTLAPAQLKASEPMLSWKIYCQYWKKLRHPLLHVVVVDALGRWRNCLNRDSSTKSNIQFGFHAFHFDVQKLGNF